ncbi:MAG TPA: PBP1A family penicillin-binding protein [Gemmatimonadaceae bacterium]|nr:PBP1A family penicillin-binding protein [Gemmatimonadaceae bacterium]
MKSSLLWRVSRLFAVTFVLVLLVAAALWMRCGLRGCPDIAHLAEDNLNGATVIKDRAGNAFARIPPLQHIKISIDSVPAYVPAAFVAMEDQRFWKHHGIDWRRVAGAAYHNIRELSIEQGSSTITMQLARNVFPDRLPASQRTIARKFEEARVAQMIEHRYSKRWILEMYLNEIYFGHGAYGIEAAAREYFGKRATQLSLGEAALLAGLPRAPTVLNPRSNLELALKRRRVVLRRMVHEADITAAQAAAAAESPVQLQRGTPEMNSSGSYFVQAVRQQLEDSLADVIYTDGLTIQTTLDARLQAIAEDELNRQLVAVESGAYGKFAHVTYVRAMQDSIAPTSGTAYLQAAVVFMDPQTGDVRALIGGRDYHDSQFNRALSASRQTASTFKPFVYAAAVAAGQPPSLRLSDEPLRLVVGGQSWSPENEDGAYHDMVTMREALAASSNVATVRLARMVGLNRVVEQARRAGLRGRMAMVPAMVLGSVEATPIELTAAYSSFATLGGRVEPRLVTRVLDSRGAVVWEQRPQRTAGLDPAVAFMVTDMLKDVVDSGSATPVRVAGYHGIAAGKTGTSNDVADLWFVGYTPALVGTIWVGFDRRTTIVRNGHSGDIAAPVWGRIMARLAYPTPDWRMPAGVVSRRIDEAGRAYADRCAKPSTHIEYFLSRNAPVPSC